MINKAPATLDDITHWTPRDSCASFHILRLDKLHPIVSGNKWYKLKYNVQAAIAAGKKTLLTFGGGYSNHLVATAYAAKEAGLSSIGLVRGNYAGEQFAPTLRDCENFGMRLKMCGKREYDALSADDLSVEFPDALIIPEGGANAAGIHGAAEIAALLPQDVTDVCLAMGTATTLNGLYAALPGHARLHGFYVAKDFRRADSLLLHPSRLPKPEVIIHPVQDLRFGKWTEEALAFIRTFHRATDIPLDVVYTSKMMMKLQELLAAGFFAKESRVVAIHTGGLQGNPPGLL